MKIRFASFAFAALFALAAPVAMADSHGHMDGMMKNKDATEEKVQKHKDRAKSHKEMKKKENMEKMKKNMEKMEGNKEKSKGHMKMMPAH